MPGQVSGLALESQILFSESCSSRFTRQVRCEAALWSKKELGIVVSKVVVVMNESQKPDVDALIDEGIEVFIREWESNNPGNGSGTDRVIMFNGKFWAWLDDSEPEGPYASALDAIFDNELHRLNETVTTIETKELDTAALRRMIKPLGDGQFNFQLNGENVTNGTSG